MLRTLHLKTMTSTSATWKKLYAPGPRQLINDSLAKNWRHF